MVLLLGVSIQAFDTGPHFDLTHAALAEHKFSDVPIKIVQVENWLTDYYSSSPTISASKRLDLEKLHFDNLFTSKQVANYWGWLIANLRSESQKAATANDPLRMLVTMGIGLHAVQDFYTHSNWVETHPRAADGPYRTDTFLSSGVSTVTPTNANLFTGKYPEDRKTGPGSDTTPAGALSHGGYSGGLNKDSSVREHWDEAYVFAYAGSHELIGLFEKWAYAARPGFWKTVGEYRIDSAENAKLGYDIRALRNMSMWIKGKGQDGHWKGDKSGSARFFSAFSSKWVGKNSSVFVKIAAEGKIQNAIANKLYTDDSSPALPVTPKFSLKRRIIVVRATQIAEIKENNPVSKRLASTGGTDFYARITVGGQEYWERTMQKSRDTADPWFVIHFADQAERAIPIKIAVWDEDDTDSVKDQQMDINPLPGKKFLDLVFNPTNNDLSGDLSGIFNTRAAAVSSEGAKPDTDRARIRFFVAQFTLR